MNLEFSEEQTLLTNLVERFTTEHYDLAKRAKYVETAQGFSEDNWKLMADTGLLTVPFSEQSGGLGGSAEDLICVMQPLGKAVAVEPILFSTILAGSLLEAAGTQAQKQEWIPQIISGQSHIALAHIERGARFDLRYVKTTFKTGKDGAALTGHKTFVLGGALADGFIVSAITGPNNASDNAAAADISLFFVKADASGLTQHRYRLTDGSIALELELKHTPATALQGDFDDLIRAIALTKIGACAEMVGLMELLLEDTLNHLKTREQFGRPLSKMQVIQHRLADCYVSLELCRSHLLRMAASQPTDGDYQRMTSGSKAYISKAAMDLAEEAVQLHGGMGITDELIVGHAMKRIMVLSNLFGDADSEINNFIGLAA